MSDDRRLSELWTEMERVGIDPHAFPAGLDVSHELAVQLLCGLPDGVGPMAFLAAIREEQQRTRALGAQPSSS